jgi:hypothetical protein
MEFTMDMHTIALESEDLAADCNDLTESIEALEDAVAEANEEIDDRSIPESAGGAGGSSQIDGDLLCEACNRRRTAASCLQPLYEKRAALQRQMKVLGDTFTWEEWEAAGYYGFGGRDIDLPVQGE